MRFGLGIIGLQILMMGHWESILKTFHGLEAIAPWVESAAHASLALGLLLIFRGFEDTERNESILRTIRKLFDEQRVNLTESILPLSAGSGLVGAYAGIDFKKIILEALPNSTIHIFFTYHANLTDSLNVMLDAMLKRNVRFRLLLGDYTAPAIKRRFSYIGWIGRSEKTSPNLDRLRIFLTSEIPSAVEPYRVISACDMLQVRTFDHLPDMPIIIETAAFPDDESGQNRVGEIRRVLTGFYVLKPAVDGILLEWRNAGEGSLARAFMEYFERRWDTGKVSPISGEDFVESSRSNRGPPDQGDPLAETEE